MNYQPVSLLIGEGILAVIGLALAAVLALSWVMGRSQRARNLREQPPARGAVAGHAHHPASLNR